MSAELYTPPEWSDKPNINWKLYSVREGSILNEYNLSEKPFYTIGSNSRDVDIIYTNPLVSSLHAIIQFNQEGKAFLFDNQSTNKTWMGDRPIPSKEYIELKDGDKIVFGQQDANRIFFINKVDSFPCIDNIDKQKNIATTINEMEIPESLESGISNNDDVKNINKDSLSGQHTQAKKPIFDEKGKLLSTACDILYKKEEKYLKSKAVLDLSESVHKDELIDSTDKIEIRSIIQLSTNNLTGFIDIPLIRKKLKDYNLNSEQNKLLNQIDHLQKNVLKEIDIEDEKNSEYMDKHKYLLFEFQKNFCTNDSDYDDAVYLSPSYPNINQIVSQTKAALDDRLFDENDNFFDRSKNIMDTTLKVPLEKKDIEKEISKLQEEIDSLKDQFIQNNISENKEDILDKYMRQNNNLLIQEKIDKIRKEQDQLKTELPDSTKQITKEIHIKKNIYSRSISEASKILSRFGRQSKYVKRDNN